MAEHINCKHDPETVEIDMHATMICYPSAGCCVDAQMCIDEAEGVILRTLGCPNRCGVETPISVPSVCDVYPCGLSGAHGGEHWIPDGYVRATNTGSSA